MKKKQMIALLLVVVLLTMNVFCADVLFTDISSHWGESIITEAVEKGIIKGRGDNKFDPDGVVTSAEFTAMCVRALNQNVTIDDEDTFGDVTKDDWFYNEIEAAVQLGLVKKAETFMPNEPISRERMATIAFRAFGGDAEAAELNFTDADEIADWAKEPIAKSITIGLINGMGDGTFQPKAKLTRAQGAASGSRLYNKLAEKTPEPKPTISPSPSYSGGGGGGGGCGGIIPTVTPTPSVSPSASPVVSPSASSSTVPSTAPSAVPSTVPSVEPSVTPPEVPTERQEIGCFPNEDWIKSGIAGPEFSTGLETVTSETAYTDKTGASAIYYPGIENAGNVNVYIYLLPQGEKDDTQMKVEIVHNGKTTEKIIDTSTEEEGYYYLGWYDFAGSADEYEYVKVTRISDDDTFTRLSMVRFDFLGMSIDGNFDENSDVNGQYYIAPYYNDDEPVVEPTTSPDAEVTEDTETTLKEPEKWDRIFAEFFDGNAVNEQIWAFDHRAPNTHTLCSRWKENASVKNGKLHLLAKKEVRPITMPDGTIIEQPFTAASIHTRAVKFLYGYYEAKYTYAGATGTNNSFWLVTAGITKEGDSEIDINEGHYPNEMSTNIHGFDPNKGDSGGKVQDSYRKNIDVSDCSEEMTIFHLEWDAEQLKFGYNGTIIRTSENKYCKNPVRILLSLAVLDFAGEVTDAIDGTEMIVDWVKVYEKK